MVYVYPDNLSFPNPPQDSLQSFEPADIEDTNRRAYFVNLDREAVIKHYKKEFMNVYGLPTIRLNYPPEESQTIIRDQTRSTYLEELVHPLRGGVYINGFEPKTERDAINVEGKNWDQKVIIKYVPSSRWIRLFVVFLTTISLYLVYYGYKQIKETN